MTSYVVITEEIDLMVKESSPEKRKEIGELMKAVPLDPVFREMVKDEMRSGIILMVAITGLIAAVIAAFIFAIMIPGSIPLS